eukprot:TRINITY_DN10500_c0_g1_i1.p1 TRINITY_DN10500_c0_g1~~TRINITY_DN10500_c0_g1_i1.p1  ORF type:complete len:331 (+),score=60.69 TRINITY_DN10500_c0_g1_i1:83-1075(+)
MDLVQPKRPVCGGFGQFLAAHRVEFSKACNSQKSSTISVTAGAAWKNLTAEEKAPYHKMFKEAKVRFEKDMAAFLAAGGTKVLGLRASRALKRKGMDDRKTGQCPKQAPVWLAKLSREAFDIFSSSKQIEIDRVQPKPPVGGGYGQFLAQNRAEFTKACKGGRASAVSVMAGAMWKSLTPEQKAPHQLQFEKAKAIFEKDMAAFVAAGGTKALGRHALKTQKRKAMEDARRMVPIRPKKPTCGAFGIFLSRKRPVLRMQCPCRVMGITELASVTWNVMSDAEKKPYENEYALKKEAGDEAMKSRVPTCRRAKAGNEGTVDGGDDASGEKA